jgi:CRP-like cAMP-binding protein
VTPQRIWRRTVQALSVSQFERVVDPDSLGSGSVFGAISREARRFLVDEGKLFSVAKGDTVFDFGDPGKSFFIVCSGSLDFFKDKDGDRYLTRTIGYGEEIGFVAMIALHDHVGKAVAREDSVILEVSSALFARLHENYPMDFGVLTLNLARDMARVVRKLSDRLVEHAIVH